jgi:hypothetical protein
VNQVDLKVGESIRTTFSPGRVTARDLPNAAPPGEIARKSLPNQSNASASALTTFDFARTQLQGSREFPGLHRSCVAVPSEFFFSSSIFFYYLQLISILAHSRENLGILISSWVSK